MRRQPLLSVAIPTRNYGCFLARALDSALRAGALADVPYEIVVVDDASTDETREVLERYRLAHPSIIRAFYRPASRGVAVAKNSAISRSSGRFIALLDSDDEFCPEKFRVALAPLLSGKAEFVTNDFLHWFGPDRHYVMTAENWSAVDVGFWPPSTWVFERGVVRHSEQMFFGNDDLEWLARHRATLRHIHLPVVLNIQHAHTRNFGNRPDSMVPGYQMLGRMRGHPHPDDRRAPSIWACERCGRQVLRPATCCERPTCSRPIFYYCLAESADPPPPEPPEFSFVFLTRDHAELTRRAVESLLPKLEGEAAELIFVDNGSTDGTLDAIRSWSRCLPVKLICVRPEEPFNYSANCNRGARAATGSYLVLANNDVEFLSHGLVPALRAALSDLRVGVAGVSTVWGPGQQEPEWESERDRYCLVPRPVPGYCWAMRREVFWELGGMDEAFSGYGYDELDFEYRAVLAHYRMAQVRAEVLHHGSATYLGRFDRGTKWQMQEANRVVFERKHQAAIYIDAEKIEPFCRHAPPALSVVIVAHNAGPALRRTLEAAAGEGRAHDGSTQLVVVNCGSTDDTRLVLAEYRRRLPRLLTIIEMGEGDSGDPFVRGRARAIGQLIVAGRAGEPLPLLDAAP